LTNAPRQGRRCGNVCWAPARCETDDETDEEVFGLLPALVASVAAAGVVLAVMAGYVSRRQSSRAGLSLAVLLVAVAWWGLTYAVEISTDDLSARLRWGDWKYVGISVLPPAWLTFCLQYTGRARRVTWRLLALLAVEPVVLLTLLAVPATHDLVRYYPASAADDVLPVVATGPLFWVHLVYANVILVGATTLFVVRMVRVSRLYRRVAVVLVAAALLPWAANLLHNFGVGPFERVDLTPTAFVVTGAVLVWGLHRERLVNLKPLARGMVMEHMADAVIVLDAFRRVVDANPATARLLGRRRWELTGRSWHDLVPDNSELAPADLDIGHESTQVETTFVVDGAVHHFDARRQPLRDKAGATAGELIVLRDVTERKEAETQLHELLTERTRVAAALQASLQPAALPHIPRVELAGVYEPAGDGREIGGDFFDVFPLGAGAWGIVLGDVSGKGAEAAAVTALIRYTLRTLATLAATPRAPRDVLCDLNAALLRDSTDEHYCTLVYGVATSSATGLEIRLCLGGHHPPLVRRSCGEVEPVGALGTALGLIPEPDLVETRLELHEGDLLCLFTDGLVEARHGRDLFETTRASTVLEQTQQASAHDTLAALSAAARTFRGEPLGDDLALLALKVNTVADVDRVGA
jgi:PAS domain S-box-containing protein